jgi:hypothetical protein
VRERENIREIERKEKKKERKERRDEEEREGKITNFTTKVWSQKLVLAIT